MNETQEKIKETVENINKQIVENEKENPTSEPEFLNEEELFRILEGKGIEYKTTGGLIVYIKPLRLKDYELLGELLLMVDMLGQAVKLKETVEKVSDIFSKIFKIDAEQIKDNFDIDDLRKVVGLMSTVVKEGKDLFKKKELSVLFRK